MTKKNEVKFVPLYDNVLITKKDTNEVKTTTGIIIVNDDVTKSYAEGTVIKVGDGFKLPDGGTRPLKVKVGDTIIFRKMTEISIDVDGSEHFVVSEANIIGIL